MLLKGTMRQKVLVLVACLCALLAIGSNFLNSFSINMEGDTLEEFQEAWEDIQMVMASADMEKVAEEVLDEINIDESVLSEEVYKDAIDGAITIIKSVHKTKKGIAFSNIGLMNDIRVIKKIMKSVVDGVLPLGDFGIGNKVSSKFNMVFVFFIILVIVSAIALLTSCILAFLKNGKLPSILLICVGGLFSILNLIYAIYLLTFKMPAVMGESLQGIISIGPGIGIWIALIAYLGILACGILLLLSPSVAGSFAALVGIGGMYAGATLAIAPGEEIVIGRDTTMSHLVIDNSQVSRKHCGVRYDASTKSYQVIDYSSNGTFVNGSMLQKGMYQVCAPGSILSVDDFDRFQLQ